MDNLSIDIELESPPLVFQGGPSSSSGALLSGQVELCIAKAEIEVKLFEMNLVEKVTTKKPVVKNCPECQVAVTVLKCWHFLPGRQPAYLQTGKHHFPFSYHLQGHLPATSNNSLASIDYLLEVRVKPDSDNDVFLSRPLHIGRALKPTSDKVHTRYYKPIDTFSHLTLPLMIHPIGLFTGRLQVSNICKKQGNHETRQYLLTLNWRLEEHCTNISPACPKHADRASGEDKGIKQKSMRVIGRDEIKTGFNHDFETPGGQIDVEFQACVKPGGAYTCDVVSRTGFTVAHMLVVELLFSEHRFPCTAPRYMAPTGSICKMNVQGQVVLTDRAGLGIAWDEEQPPLYEDVPSSPPGY